MSGRSIIFKMAKIAIASVVMFSALLVVGTLSVLIQSLLVAPLMLEVMPRGTAAALSTGMCWGCAGVAGWKVVDTGLDALEQILGRDLL